MTLHSFVTNQVGAVRPKNGAWELHERVRQSCASEICFNEADDASRGDVDVATRAWWGPELGAHHRESARQSDSLLKLRDVGSGDFDTPPGRYPSRGELRVPPGECPCPIPSNVGECPNINPFRNVETRYFEPPPASALKDLRIEGHYSLLERRAAEAAYGLVSRNLDVLRWVRCVFSGRTDFDSCIVSKFGGDGWKKLSVQFESKIYSVTKLVCSRDNNSNWLAFGNYWTGNVNLCRYSEYIARWVRNIQDTSLSDQCRNSYVLYLASLLVHEGLHTCFRSTGFRHNETVGSTQTCDGVYRIANMFHWAVIRSHPPGVFDVTSRTTASFCRGTGSSYVNLSC